MNTYVLQLVGVKHFHPKVPEFGQTGTGKILLSTMPWPDMTVTWKTMANYPGA